MYNLAHTFLALDLAKGASKRFFELARKYRVDLEQFV